VFFLLTSHKCPCYKGFNRCRFHAAPPLNRLGDRPRPTGKTNMDYYNPTKQTTFDTGGNCLSAVIATLFDVKITDIPLFADDDEQWGVELSKWMARKFGKYIAPMKLANPEDVFIFNGSLVITAINSPNPKVERHAVITRGDKIFFDPMKGEVSRQITDDMDATFMVIGDVRTVDTQPAHRERT